MKCEVLVDWLTFDGAKDKRGMESIAFSVLFQLLASTERTNVSRIDIACDDRAGYLSMDDVLNNGRAKNTCTESRQLQSAAHTLTMLPCSHSPSVKSVAGNGQGRARTAWG